LLFGLEHVDRRLPPGGTGACGRRLKELAVELLGLFDEGASLRPHLIFRITHHANLGKPTFNSSAGPLQHNLAAANTSKQVSVKK
jgi:hypothetical protein